MAAPRGLVQWLDQELHRSGLLPRGGKLLVAVSGGADSVALLRLLVAVNGSDYWKWKLVVGHVDHGIRGRASAADARFVERLARELGLGFVMRKLELGKEASEMKARIARFNAVRAMLAAKRCVGVIMAHHADDLAETVLMHMFRGCGVDGLGGMAEEVRFEGGGKELIVWRPLLQVRGAALRAYLKQIGQTWREDVTNTSAKYTRNRVRREVMPVVEKIWPEAVAAVGRLSRIAREVSRVSEAAEGELWKRGTILKKEAAFPRGLLREALPAAVSDVLRRAAFEVFSVEVDDFERVWEALRLIRGNDGGKVVELGKGVAVVLDGKWVRVKGRRSTRGAA